MRNFNPIFYEYQALSDISNHHDVMINVMIPDRKPSEEWMELDGVFKNKGKRSGIEVKNYALDDSDIGSIQEKFEKMNSDNAFDEIIIIAPKFELKKSYDVELTQFQPDIGFLKKFYEDYNPKLPDVFIERLGWHHFRFQSPFGLRVFKSQVDKRISSIQKLKVEINTRLSWPPLKVYWSAMMFLNPKELFYSASRAYPIKGPLFFDVDCKNIHYPCVLKHGLCKTGLKLVEQEVKKLVEILIENDYSEIYKVFSGRKGQHVYVFDIKDNGSLKERVSIVKKLLDARIKVDAKNSTDIKNATTFPSTLNGISLKEAKVLD